MRHLATAAIALISLAGMTGGQASAQQQPGAGTAGEDAAVPGVVRVEEPDVAYVPSPWEGPRLRFPILDRVAIVVVHEDANQLVFLAGNELGSFRPAPEGGTPFFGSGQPIFGMAAPPVLPSRVLRPLGSGDTGDRFLGQRPPVDPTTVIPKLAETFDRRRESFAFLDGIPPIPDAGSGGSLPFPLVDMVDADPVPGCPDNNPACDEPAPEEPTTTPPTTLRPELPPPTTTTAPAPLTTTPTTAPPTSLAPPAGTTTTTSAPTTTTTTAAPTTTTTAAPTTTTTAAPTTTTTAAPTTTTTTQPPASPPPATALVLSNQREQGSLCLSNATGGTHNPNCDRLFSFAQQGYLRTGTAYPVNLTLWNIAPQSDVDGTRLRTFASGGCSSSPNAASHADSLCKSIELTIQRYSDAARTIPSQCVYGGGTSTECSFSTTRTLAHFGATHTSMATGAQIGNGLQIDAKAYLRISVQIRDTGLGAENRLIGQEALLPMTWRLEAD